MGESATHVPPPRIWRRRWSCPGAARIARHLVQICVPLQKGRTPPRSSDYWEIRVPEPRKRAGRGYLASRPGPAPGGNWGHPRVNVSASGATISRVCLSEPQGLSPLLPLFREVNWAWSGRVACLALSAN